MPIREYECSKGHKTESLVFGEPPAEKDCPECVQMNAEQPMFHPAVARATLVLFSKPWSPSADFKSAEARLRYKEGSSNVRS